MVRNYNHILLRDPLAATLGQPKPDKRSKAELAEAAAAMRLEEQRRRAAEVARAEADRKIALAEATAKAKAERKLAEAERTNNSAKPARHGISAMFD
ncbi:hypothetical protein [Mesorhizobium sp.]|uniref:hypothetical protein n=1 Tax=Mesorhizobium sp. TaxID=1871066 RepID=UPI000FE541C6|nr:hypothetical protein [Mesorhizobium sp.]RWD70204.1 MAG: hypothetical protein EOS37_15490 [Mesorhizobium sp.]